MEDSFSAPCRNSKRFRILECDADFRLNVTDVFHKHVLTISFRDGLLPYRNTQDNKSHVSMITRSCTVIKSCFGPFVLSDSVFIYKLKSYIYQYTDSYVKQIFIVYRLCCECGTEIEPNASNMCVSCIRTQVDITEGIPKQAVLYFCRNCNRYKRMLNRRMPFQCLFSSLTIQYA